MDRQAASTLQARWDGGALAATADEAPITVGRAADAHVRFASRYVSREHLRLAAEDGQWVAIDRSSRGTYAPDGRRVERVAIGRDEVTLRLGAPDGPTLRLVSAPAAVDEPGSVPVVPPVETGTAWTVATSDPTLRLELGGRKHLFTPPARVVVGRDPACEVVSASELVSRQHVAFTSAGGGWSIEDLGSSRGTFVDGRRLRRPARALGAFVAVLGDADAGERLQVVTAGTHRRPRRVWPAVTVTLAAAAAAVAAVVIIVGALVPASTPVGPPDGGGDVANTRQQLDAAARATVLVEGYDASGESTGWGSGSVLSGDGLILTNAHVVAPLERGDGGVPSDPVVFGVHVVRDVSEPVELGYAAELVAVHPTFDAALLRVVADADGEEVDRVDTGVIGIGDSGSLVSGTPAHQLGFPGIAQTDELSIAAVTIQSFAPLPRCEDVPPDVSSCSDGEVLRDGRMNFTGGSLGRGSSGGPLVHDGMLIAINVGAALSDEEVTHQTFAQPVHTLTGWLAENGVPGVSGM